MMTAVDPKGRFDKDWDEDGAYSPRPDYLSSSRKRLAPKLIYKGGILNKWGKKMAAGPIEEFVDHLQQKLEEKLENGYPPDAPILTDFSKE